MKGVTLSLTANLPPEALQKLTRDISNTIRKETDIDAKLKEQPAGPGMKGGGSSIGQIVVDLISGGAIKGLFNVLQSYVKKESSLQMEFTRGDGAKMKFTAKNLKSDQITKTVELVQAFRGSK